MWYLNYCSPFIYNTTGSPQVIRYILYSCIAVEFLVYIFYIAKYKWFGCTQIIIQRSLSLRINQKNITKKIRTCILFEKPRAIPELARYLKRHIEIISDGSEKIQIMVSALFWAALCCCRWMHYVFTLLSSTCIHHLAYDSLPDSCHYAKLPSRQDKPNHF